MPNNDLSERKNIKEKVKCCVVKIKAAKEELKEIQRECKHPEEKLHRSRSKYDGGDEYKCVDCGSVSGRSLF